MSIEGISGIGSGQVDNIKGDKTLQKNEGVRPVPGVAKEGEKLSVVDKVEISDEVNDLQNTLSKLKAKLEKVPDVRSEKVEEAKKRMESGFYDQEDVIRKVASEIKKKIIDVT